MRIIGLFISIVLLTLMGCSNVAKSPEDVVKIIIKNIDDSKAMEPVLMSEEILSATFSCQGSDLVFSGESKQIRAALPLMSAMGVKVSNVKVTSTKPIGSKKADEQVANCKMLKDVEFAVVEYSVDIKMLGLSKTEKDTMPTVKIDGNWYAGGPKSLTGMGTRSDGAGGLFNADNYKQP